MKHLILTSFLLYFFANVQLAAAQPNTDPLAQNTKSIKAARKFSPTFAEYIVQQNTYNAPTISPQELEELLKNGTYMILLDTRSPQEYEISHLKSAKRVGYDDFTTERVWMVRRNLPVVVYCTTGDRSQAVASYMLLMGFENVKVLDGAIINWSNQGLPLVNKQNAKTNQVHVQTKENAGFLKKGKAVW